MQYWLGLRSFVGPSLRAGLLGLPILHEYESLMRNNLENNIAGLGHPCSLSELFDCSPLRL